MRKDQGFDMLENADDRTIERLSEVPVLTEKEKERILKMSKDKLKRRYRTENIEAGVSGVETYRRPKWYSFAALAASLVLVCGIVGTGVLMNRNGMAPDENENKLPKAAVTTSSVPGTTTAGTVTTAKAETKTTAANENNTVDTVVSPADTSLSATLIALFEQQEKLNDIVCGRGVDTDSSDRITFEFDGTGYVYEYVTDTRFSTVDEAMSYFKQTVTGTIWSENFQKCFYDNFSPAIFRESDGKLYFLVEDREANRQKLGNFGEPQISNVTDDYFDFTLTADLSGIKTSMTGNAVCENGKWKLSYYQHESVTDGNTGGDAPSDPQTNDSPFISDCKNEAKSLWDATYTSGGNASIEYTLYDMDGDGEREFLIKYGTCEADYRLNIYTYKNGYLEQVGDLGGGHISLCRDTVTGDLVVAWGHMGSGSYTWFTISNSSVVGKRQETVDYSIIGKEDVKGFENVVGLSTYGAYSLSDGIIHSYASESGGYQEYDGLDLSFIK